MNYGILSRQPLEKSDSQLLFKNPTSIFPILDTPEPNWINNDNFNWEVKFSSSILKNIDSAYLSDISTQANGDFGSGFFQFNHSLLMSDGRVFCVPRSSTTARIYDPKTNSTSIPNGTFPGSNAFYGSVLMKDGRIFCVPTSSATARIYNPYTDTLSTPGGNYPGSVAFFGGVLLQDGRVFCVPANSTTARIYNPYSNTLSIPNGSYPGSQAYYGGVLLPDGRVLCVPHNATAVRIYNPFNNSLFIGRNIFSGLQAYSGGILLTDNRVFLVPYGTGRGPRAAIYNPITDRLDLVQGLYQNTQNGFSCGILPGGYPACFAGDTLRVYNPFNNETKTYSAPAITTNSSNGVVLFDGRIFRAPISGGSATIYGKEGLYLDYNIRLSSFYNK